jgi:DNA polymerase
MERFLPGYKISDVHGKAMRREIDGIGSQIFYTLYHPAAALYNGSMRNILIKDFKRIPKIIEKIKKEQV